MYKRQDQASALVGGLGVAPGANIGKTVGSQSDEHNPPVFEPVHGSAPDIAGKDIANPIGMLLSAKMMLEYLEFRDEAKLLSKSIQSCIQRGFKTLDLGGDLGTVAFTDKLITTICSLTLENQAVEKTVSQHRL